MAITNMSGTALPTMNIYTQQCKYYLPCGYCDKKDMLCVMEHKIMATEGADKNGEKRH